MNYDQQITLEQALDLQNRIKASEMPDISYKFHPMEDPIYLSNNGIDHPNNEFYLTRPDYAQYIIGNKPLPKGYGYPNKELSSGIYEGLYYNLNHGKSWIKPNSLFGSHCTGQWYDYNFVLISLAQVEADAEPERTEINAAQISWCLENPVQDPAVNKHWCNGKEYMSLCLVDYDNVTSNPNGYYYEILTTTYNALPDEFKALAEPKPSMPAHFADSTDWKAKYSELERATTTTLNTSHGQRSFSDYVNGYCCELDLSERVCRLEAEKGEFTKQLTEATASADRLQDRLTDAQNCIAAMETKYNEIVKAAKYALDRQQTEQKTLDNYADAKCKSEIAVYQFYNLLK